VATMHTESQHRSFLFQATLGGNTVIKHICEWFYPV